MSHLETIFNTIYGYPPPAEQTHTERTNLNEHFWQQPHCKGTTGLPGQHRGNLWETSQCF